jgi:hypothetical protein
MPITREVSAISAEKQSGGRCTKNHQHKLDKRQDKSKHQNQDTRHSVSVRLFYITNNNTKINIFIIIPYIDTDQCTVIVKIQTNENSTSCTLNSAYEPAQNNNNVIITLLNTDSQCCSNWGCSPNVMATPIHLHHQYCPWHHHPFDNAARDQQIGHLQTATTLRPISPKLIAASIHTNHHINHHLEQQRHQYEQHDELPTASLSLIQSNEWQEGVTENDRWIASVVVRVSQPPSQCPLNPQLMSPPPCQILPLLTRLNLAIQIPSWLFLNTTNPYNDPNLLYTETTTARTLPAPLPIPLEHHDYIHTNIQSQYHITLEHWHSLTCMDFNIRQKYNERTVTVLEIFHITLIRHTNKILLTPRHANKLVIMGLTNYLLPKGAHHYFQYDMMTHPTQIDRPLSLPREVPDIPSTLPHRHHASKISTHTSRSRSPSQGESLYLPQLLPLHRSHFHCLPTLHHPTRQTQLTEIPTKDGQLARFHTRASPHKFHLLLLQQRISHYQMTYNIVYPVQFQTLNQRLFRLHSQYQHFPYHYLNSNQSSYLQSQKYISNRPSNRDTNTSHNLCYKIVSSYKYNMARHNTPYGIIMHARSYRDGTHSTPYVSHAKVRQHLFGVDIENGHCITIGITLPHITRNDQTKLYSQPSTNHVSKMERYGMSLKVQPLSQNTYKNGTIAICTIENKTHHNGSTYISYYTTHHPRSHELLSPCESPTTAHPSEELHHLPWNTKYIKIHLRLSPLPKWFAIAQKLKRQHQPPSQQSHQHDQLHLPPPSETLQQTSTLHPTYKSPYTTNYPSPPPPKRIHMPHWLQSRSAPIPLATASTNRYTSPCENYELDQKYSLQYGGGPQISQPYQHTTGNTDLHPLPQLAIGQHQLKKQSRMYHDKHHRSNITDKQNYHPKAARNQFFGGGPTNTKTCIDVDTLCLNTITHAYNTWHVLPDSSLDIIDTNHISHLEPWRPCTTLRHHTNTYHPLTRNIKQADVISIKEVCQLPPTQPIIRSTRAKDLCITTEHLKRLLTYNEMTSDSVIMLYVEGFCNRHKLTYMNSNFIPHLREKGWRIVKHYFASNRRAHKRGINRPNITGERAILIPAFIHNNHWVAIVRREIRDRVLFLYSDDLNDPNTEGVLRTLITDRTDPNFCPSNAIWMHCKCNTYHPHSNECGPRTILALSILALHSQPYPEMLLPLMDENLAQITRTRIAASLVSGNFDTDNYKHVLSFSSFNDTRTSNRAASNPADIILWNEVHCQQHHNQTLHESTNIIHPESPTCTITQPNHNTIQFGEKQTTSYNLSQVNTSSTCTQMDEDNESTVTPPQTRSKKITDYIPTRTSHDNNQTSCTHHLDPFGTPLTIPDPSKNLRIMMQNTQFTFQITNEDHEKLHAIEQLYNLQTSIFVSISPNVNWNNPSHWVSFKQPFKRTFQQIHISATSSDIGKEPHYRNKPNLTGGAAILSLNHWASKVCNTSTDPRGHGSYTVTTYQGKNRKKLSIIGAYISVLKGGKAGDNTLHTQQMTLLERQAMQNNTIWEPTKCPRKEAIKALSSIIKKLQDEDHAIVLAINANQTPTECYSKSTVRQYSIEWLRREHGLDDPFIELINQRPPSTTKNPGRDIDYILTYGVPVAGISTLGCDNLAESDHVGICIDIDVQKLFETTYSELGKLPRRKLTLDNVRAKSKYESFIMQEMQSELLWERTHELYLIAIKGLFDDQHEVMLNEIDDIISRILL